MKRLLALALLAAPVPAASATVEVANGNWGQLPPLEFRGPDHLSTKVMQRLFEITSERQCKLGRRAGRQLDLNLSFAAHFEPNGTLTKVVLPRLDCPEAEGVIGGALLAMIAAGDYKPTGQNLEGWYRGSFGFGFVG
ncbi:hypothetical protein [Sphingomonas sp.]|uniref:hypothetical protein n=1 Tax=Sphingomonas sp. TaxID=28214 RepID=UPI00286E9195|nr:hypothetical protein [Sphingomonas sp.]